MSQKPSSVPVPVQQTPAPQNTDKPTYLIWIGPKAGVNLCTVCRRVLLIGENAGRNIEVANDVIIIGDNIFGVDNQNRQITIAETLPELPDIYLQDFLNSFKNIVTTLQEEFSKHFGADDIQKAVVAVEKMANRARKRWNTLLEDSIVKADKNYAVAPR